MPTGYTRENDRGSPIPVGLLTGLDVTLLLTSAVVWRLLVYLCLSVYVRAVKEQVYLLTPMDCATLLTQNRQYHTAGQVKSPGSKRCERYLKHIATQTVTCQLLAHTYTVRPKLHLVDLVSTYYVGKFATNTQEIEPVELEPYCRM